MRRFREKPGPDEAITTNMVNAGVYLIDASLLARMPAGRAVSIEREFFPALIEDGVPCFGWALDGYWRDIGSPAAYRAAHADLLSARVRTPLAPPGEPRDGSWVAAGASVAADARVGAPSLIGGRATLAPGCQVGPLTVIGEGCAIAVGARVEGSVLWERVDVGAGAVLRECVVGADARIGAGAVIGPDAVVASGAIVPAGAAVQ